MYEEKEYSKKAKGIIGLTDGIVMFSFGIYTLIAPAGTFKIMLGILGLFLVINGVMSGLSGIINRKINFYWLIWFLSGFFQFVFGILFVVGGNELTRMGVTLGFLLMGFYFLISGIMMLIFFKGLHIGLTNYGDFIAYAVFMIFFGIIVCISPFETSLFVFRFLSLFVIMFGGMHFFLGLGYLVNG